MTPEAGVAPDCCIWDRGPYFKFLNCSVMLWEHNVLSHTQCLPFFSSPIPLFLFLPGSISTGKCPRISPSPHIPELSVSADVYIMPISHHPLQSTNNSLHLALAFTACCSCAASTNIPPFDDCVFPNHFADSVVVS